MEGTQPFHITCHTAFSGIRSALLGILQKSGESRVHMKHDRPHGRILNVLEGRPKKSLNISVDLL